MNIEDELIARMEGLGQLLATMTEQNLVITQELTRITQALQRGQEAASSPDVIVEQMNKLMEPITHEIAAIRQSLE